MHQIKLMVDELACLNEVFDFKFKKLSSLNKRYNMIRIEEEAVRISADKEIEFEFLDGESSSVEGITEFYSVQYLSKYLNEVFEML